MIGARSRDAQQRVGHYELLVEIARGVVTRASTDGAEAAVAPLWAARASEGPDVGRFVVVRRIARDLLDAESLIRLERALSVANQIREPNIVAVLDLVVERNEVAIVSEYVEGEILRSLHRAAA